MRMFYWLMPAIFSVIMLWPPALTAQDNAVKPPPIKKNHDILDRIDFGGYLGASFSSNATYIEVSPLASYRITPKFHAGLGLTYMYSSYSDPYMKYSSSSYGGSIFARYFVWRDLFLHLEYAPLYRPDFIPYPNPSPNVHESPWAQDVLIGGGYRQWVGDKAFMSLMFLWNVNETVYSPYINPIIRIGFGIGL
jgi:hypothetical protein